jgi:hypothetical protein
MIKEKYLLDSEVVSSQLGIVNGQVDSAVATDGILDLEGKNGGFLMMRGFIGPTCL